MGQERYGEGAVECFVGFDTEVFDLDLREDALLLMEELAVKNDLAQVVEGMYQRFIEQIGYVRLRKPSADFLELGVRIRRNSIIC